MRIKSVKDNIQVSGVSTDEIIVLLIDFEIREQKQIWLKLKFKK